MNILSPADQKLIWVPEVIFDNTRSLDSTRNDEKAFVMIERKGNFSRSWEPSGNTLIFEGSENPITISRVYDIDFICRYQLLWFPFDHQNCNMSFTMRGVIGNQVDLTTGDVFFTGSRQLSHYFIKNISMNSKVIPSGEICHGNKVIVMVRMQRQLLGTILNVFIPTILMNLIGHCTNYFEATYFDAVVTLNLTTMLVLTTMFSAVNANLPATSYIKMIDIWLMVNLLILCLEIILHIYMNMHSSRDYQEI